MNIVILDCTQNYGYRFSASNTKMELLAKGLTLMGNSCVIMNGVGGYDGIRQTEVKQVADVGKVITYPYRSIPVVGFIANLPLLVRDLKRLAKGDTKNVMILSNVYLHIYFLYVCVGRFLGYRVVTIAHEWVPTVKRRYWIQNFMGSIYARTFGYGINAILPISHYIWQRSEHFGKSMLMTPILAEYPAVPPMIKKSDRYVYCVYAFYFRVITMIVDSYKEYLDESDTPYRLTLVLSGSDAQIEKVRKYVRNLNLQTHIDIMSKLPYAELLRTYQSARALLIPLNPNHEQDHARFSQKIAEYLSSGTPVISNNVGEIPYYFKDKENMLLADYSTKGFASALRWVQENESAAVEIGKRGFDTGASKFNYKHFGKKLNDFLISLFQK